MPAKALKGVAGIGDSKRKARHKVRATGIYAQACCVMQRTART
jgi:hypothetical protein